MAKDNSWSIQIKPPFNGMAPLYWESDYTFFGNANQAKYTKDVDMFKPDRITQGPGLSALTNGTEAGNVSTLIKGFLDRSAEDNVTYACGGDKFYTVSDTAVTAVQTITGSTDAQSIASRANGIYAFYNKATGGDIAYWNGTTLDPDWGSTVPTGGVALQKALHPNIVVGDYMVFGNGKYVGLYDGSVMTMDALDFLEGSEIADITYKGGLFYMGVNYPNVTGSNKNDSRIYYWDGFDTTYEDSIYVNGRIGCVWEELGTIFVIYEEVDSGIVKIGYVYGKSIRDIPNAEYNGDLPLFYQRTKYKGHTLFASGSEIIAFGATSQVLPSKIFSYITPTNTTLGGIATPFGTPIVASNLSTSYKLEKVSGYSTASSWKGINFDTAPPDTKSQIRYIEVHTNVMGTGAGVDVIASRDQGRVTDSALEIRATSGETIHRQYYNDGCEDIRIEFDWSVGSTTNPVEIKKVIIVGEYIRE